MEKLKDIDTFYSQKVIPLAFNESLSYMEQICNLISYIENTLVPAINNNANAIKELQEYVQELKRLLDRLDEKIDNVKEELITLINNVNDTLTNAINNLDSKVVEHINASNEKFNSLDTSIDSINTNIDTINTNIETINTNIETINTNIGTINTEIGTINTNIETTNTEVGTIKEQIQTLDSNVTQNTNDITNLMNLSFKYIKEFPLIKAIAGTYYWPNQNGKYRIIYNNNIVALFPTDFRNNVYNTLLFRDYNEYQNSFKNYVPLNYLPDNLQHLFNGKGIIVGYYLNDSNNFDNVNNLTLNYGKAIFTTTGNSFLFTGKTPEELSNKYVLIVDPIIGFSN